MKMMLASAGGNTKLGSGLARNFLVLYKQLLAGYVIWFLWQNPNVRLIRRDNN
jgi:hypothetical protein